MACGNCMTIKRQEEPIPPPAIVEYMRDLNFHCPCANPFPCFEGKTQTCSPLSIWGGVCRGGREECPATSPPHGCILEGCQKCRYSYGEANNFADLGGVQHCEVCEKGWFLTLTSFDVLDHRSCHDSPTWSGYDTSQTVRIVCSDLKRSKHRNQCSINDQARRMCPKTCELCATRPNSFTTMVKRCACVGFFLPKDEKSPFIL